MAIRWMVIADRAPACDSCCAGLELLSQQLGKLFPADPVGPLPVLAGDPDQARGHVHREARAAVQEVHQHVGFLGEARAGASFGADELAASIAGVAERASDEVVMIVADGLDLHGVTLS